MMFYAVLARFLALPWVFRFLLWRAKKTPYFHILSPDGADVYMWRWWLFNPYDYETRAVRWAWLPSIRIHHIKRPDGDRHLHDHPWDARTFVLRGWYWETRQEFPWVRLNAAGQTAEIPHNCFHRITGISPDGVYTLFVTGAPKHDWGFLVDGQKVPHKEYLKIR